MPAIAHEPGQPLGVRMRYLPEEAVQEEVVDVDANVTVAERDLGRSRIAQRFRRDGRGVLMNGARHGRLTVEEHGPALLQKREERLAIREYVVQRPCGEERVPLQQAEKVIVEDREGMRRPR